jgi:hypothetical protein
MSVIVPLANGLSTDHPVPDLPFVDDSHIPVTDQHDLENVGRHRGEGMWGGEDALHTPEGSWIGFTTDPIRHDLGWCVKWHPEHGRSVLLVRDGEASPMHMQWWNTALLFRQDGYWWDGERWFRPNQVFDDAAEKYDARPVAAAVTVTAEHLLDDNCDPRGGRLLKVANFDLDAPAPDMWLDHLALWAAKRAERAGGALPLNQCVVKLSAPELAGDQLVGLPELAQMAGIAASTLRAYIARGEGDVPLPQAVVSGRSAWAKPVARDWVERRGRSHESVAATVSAADADALPVGRSDLRDRFAKRFFSELWDYPVFRKRWALRHRSPESVLEVAQDLGLQVAGGLDDIVPLGDLAMTIQLAVMSELRTGLDLDRKTSSGQDPVFFGVIHHVVRMLDWLIRQDPRGAQYAINGIIGDAERELELRRQVVVRSLRTALALDGKLESAARREFLEKVLPPSRSDD